MYICIYIYVCMYIYIYIYVYVFHLSFGELEIKAVAVEMKDGMMALSSHAV